MEITIRRATSQDFEAFNRLMREVHRLHVENEPHIFREPDDGVVFSKERMEELLSDPEAAIFLAEAGSDAIGFAVVMLRRPPDNPIFVPRTFAMVDSIGVTRAFQSKGVGKALMAVVTVWAREHGDASIELSVHAFNRQAIRFYESLGFSTYLLRMEKSKTG
jgi:ribosomal protein S18 acetylase RimI-like enzyme